MGTDPRLAAFQRLLADASQGGQTKVDALVALSQRTVLAVPWPGGVEGYRTLVNSDSVVALPIFTDRDQLEEAARRFGWMDAQGQIAPLEIGARAAFNYAITQNLSFLVVDIAAAHALELTLDEFRPLLSAASRRESSGPYAGAGRISSTLIQAVRPTPPPGSLRSPTPRPGSVRSPTPPPGTVRTPTAPPPGPASSAAPPPSDGFTASAAFDPNAQARFGGGTGARIEPLAHTPSDEVFDALTAILREYPEVEWACVVNAARGPSAAAPVVGVRVDTGFRQRVNDIVAGLRRASEAEGATLGVLLLDDADLMRAARAQGVVFYPWRKR